VYTDSDSAKSLTIKQQLEAFKKERDELAELNHRLSEQLQVGGSLRTSTGLTLNILLLHKHLTEIESPPHQGGY